MAMLRAAAAILSMCLVLTPGASLAQFPAEISHDFPIENAFPGLDAFNLPVDLAADGGGYLYVVEQTGTIYVFPNDEETSERSVFLDLTDRVHVDNEAGLLSLSFHPDYDQNGFAYVYYIVESEPDAETDWSAILSRFTRSDADPLALSLESEVVLLEIPQPTDRHNGGETLFGPEGYLYLSLGDGSTGDDAFNNAQDLTTLLGSILRIDVDEPSEGRPYGIPADNPFAGNTEGYREEIYAYGFRNPWRFSIDPVTGHGWVGDVGESSWEEVDFLIKGGNYGWPILEGGSCYRPPTGCDESGLVPPVWYYPHEDGRSSVTGGYVYRGQRVPELVGQYIFADWSGRMMYALDYGGTNPYESEQAPMVTEITDMTGFISGFGVDENDELYILSTYHGGPVRRFVATTDLSDEAPELPETEIRLELDGAHPVRDRATILLEAGGSGRATVGIFDLTGREVAVLYDGFVRAGAEHRIEWNAEGVSSGVYVARAATSSGIISTKIIVLR